MGSMISKRDLNLIAKTQNKVHQHNKWAESQ